MKTTVSRALLVAPPIAFGVFVVFMALWSPIVGFDGFGVFVFSYPAGFLLHLLPTATLNSISEDAFFWLGFLLVTLMWASAFGLLELAFLVWRRVRA